MKDGIALERDDLRSNRPRQGKASFCEQKEAKKLY
jgi:hypothetical protein